jgi:hypothetical protein
VSAPSFLLKPNSQRGARPASMDIGVPVLRLSGGSDRYSHPILRIQQKEKEWLSAPGSAWQQEAIALRLSGVK